MHSRMFRCFWLALVLGALMWISPPASAQAPGVPEAPAAPAAPSKEDLERTIKALQDPAARDQLISQLNALLAAQNQAKPAMPAPSSVIGHVLDQLAEGAQMIGDNLSETAGAMRDMPRLQTWIDAQFSDPRRAQRWFDIIWQTVAVVAVGLLAYGIARRLLIGPLRRIVVQPGAAWGLRALALTARLLLDLLPVAAFMAAAYPMLGVVQTGKLASQVAVAAIGATAIVLASFAVARLLLAPFRPDLRLMAMSTATARSLYRWMRWIAGFGVFGYVGLQAALLVGMPLGAYALLLRIYGVIVLVILIIFVLRHRRPMASWLRGGDGEPAADGSVAQIRVTMLRRRLAELWHLLVLAYLVAVYLVWALSIENGFQYLLHGTFWTIVTLAATRLVIAGTRRLALAIAAPEGRIAQTRPKLFKRTHFYVAPAMAGLRLLAYLAAAIVIADIWGVDTIDWLSSDLGQRITAGALSVVLVLIFTFVVWEMVSSAIEGYLTETDAHGRPLPRSARARTLLPLLRNALAIVLIVFSVLIILSQIGIDIAPLLAGAGVIGLAIGFGAQTLVKDVITGLFILIEDTISVGDIINVDGKGGVVEAMSIRTLKLRDTNGALHTVPFSAVNTVTNLTKNYAFALFNVGVDYEADTDHVIAVLRGIDDEMRAEEPWKTDMLEPLEVWGVDKFEESQVTIVVRSKTRPARQWAVSREFNRRMKKRFDAEGITIPFPQLTLHVRMPEDGEDESQAGPLRFKLSERPPGKTDRDPRLPRPARVPGE